MNPHEAYSTSLPLAAHSLWKHRNLILQMVKREVIGRYKGSFVGLGWSFFNPLMLLAIYTFVFSVVFKARWGLGTDEGKFDFALVLFLGITMHGILAEILSRSPNLILQNTGYVKKVVFPLEILPATIVGSALFHAFVNIVVFLLAFFVMNGFIHPTSLFFPIIISPFILLTLGVAWCFASLGVYLRDTGQFIGILTLILLFVSPIFYPVSALPEAFQSIIWLNPLTFVVEESRQVLIFGQFPHWAGLAIYGIVSILVAWSGYFCFQKTRKGFADVL